MRRTVAAAAVAALGIAGMMATPAAAQLIPVMGPTPVLGPSNFLGTAYSGAGAVARGVGGTLNIGRTFTVSNTGIDVLQLGVFDLGNDGLAASHIVSLFSNAGGTRSLLASTTVGGGTNGFLVDGFRYTGLAAPLYLAPGAYSIIAYGLSSSGDVYGDGGGLPTGPSVTDGGFDPFEFTTVASPAYPAGGDGNNHSSASFLYTTSVPEPATWAMMVLGFGVVGFGLRYRRKSTRGRLA